MLNKSLLAPGIVLLVVLIGLAAQSWLSSDEIEALADEGGAIENVSVAFYGFAVAALWLLPKPPPAGWRISAAGSMIFAACVAREISLRRRLIDNAGDALCCTPDVALSAAAFVYLLALLAAAWLAKRYYGAFWLSLRNKQAWAATLLTTFGSLVLAQVLDRLPKLLMAVGEDMPRSASVFAQLLEELLETTAPLLIVLSLVQVSLSATPRR